LDGIAVKPHFSFRFPTAWGLGLTLALGPGCIFHTPTGEGESNGAEDSTDTESESGSESSSEDESGDGDGDCEYKVVIMGYWPPTNEMLRQWSTNPVQNPDGWQGENWGGHGFDVYSFFPEFPPDGDPTNDDIGDPGAVGSKDSDLQVDYQDTSADFWRLVDEHQPVILITTSRGGGIGWEVEALEGGHGGDNTGDASADWASDGYGPDLFPTQETVDPRSWEGITTYRQGNTLPSQLPMDAIVAAADALELVSVEIDPDGTSGNFLSGFLGLHGLLYNALAPHNVAAGHIHVGYGVPTQSAESLIEATLEAVLEAHPVGTLDCPPPG
jgi:hypothetical protein